MSRLPAIGRLTIRRTRPPSLAEWLIAFLSILFAFISKNPFPFLLGMVIFLFFLRMFFDKDMPPVLLYCFILQWLFFQAQLLDGLARDVDLVELDFISKTKPIITVLGLIAVFAYFFGVHLSTRKIPHFEYPEFVAFLRSLNLDRLFLLYGLAYVLLFFFGGLIFVFPGLAQPLFVFTEFRWGLFFLMFVTCFAQNRGKGLLLLFIVLDITLSLFSFFASFKNVFIFSFISYWIFFFRASLLSRAAVIPALALVIGLGSVWSAIKEDYRDYLNKGTGAQAVLVTRGEAFDKLIELLVTVDQTKFLDGFDELVDRLSWIGAFDAVYNFVPSHRAHEDGKLWMTGVQRTVMPRLFFPGKEGLEDSKELNYYSGLGVDEEDTSISLSAVAASYVDFGPFWMHVPIFLFGLFSGWIFRRAFKWGIYPPVGFALTMPVIFMAQVTDNTINKLLPHFVLYFICLWLIHKFVLSLFLQFVIKQPRFELQRT